MTGSSKSAADRLAHTQTTAAIVMSHNSSCTRLLFGTATNDLTGGARRGKGAMVISDTLALSSKRDRQGGGAARSPTAAAELPSPSAPPVGTGRVHRAGRSPPQSLRGRPPVAADASSLVTARIHRPRPRSRPSASLPPPSPAPSPGAASSSGLASACAGSPRRRSAPQCRRPRPRARAAAARS